MIVGDGTKSPGNAAAVKGKADHQTAAGQLAAVDVPGRDRDACLASCANQRRRKHKGRLCQAGWTDRRDGNRVVPGDGGADAIGRGYRETYRTRRRWRAA